MGKTEKPPVVLHECVYKDEVIEKLKTKDWEESDGVYKDQTHTVLFLHSKDSISKLFPFLSEYETAEFFTLLKAPYKEWRHVKVTQYNKEYGLNPAFIIELIQILYGGFSAKIMGEVIIGFLSTAKPIIASIPYKDDCAVFIIAPALTPDGLEETEIYGKQYELDFTIGDKPAYYDLERQIFGFCVDGKIISMDEYREQVRVKIEPPKIPEKVKIEKVKIRVLENIPTFMGTDGEIYKLNKGDTVELPKTNADRLCERGVVEPFVERPPEKVIPEKVRIHGILKTRYRCPICYRAAPDNFCMVHSDVEAIDLLAADESFKEAVIDLTFWDLFKTKQPEKKRWTIKELHEAIGIDTDYAPEFLTKPRLPETYAEHYARELGVEIEEVGIPKIRKEVAKEEIKPRIVTPVSPGMPEDDFSGYLEMIGTTLTLNALEKKIETRIPWELLSDEQRRIMEEIIIKRGEEIPAEQKARGQYELLMEMVESARTVKEIEDATVKVHLADVPSSMKFALMERLSEKKPKVIYGPDILKEIIYIERQAELGQKMHFMLEKSFDKIKELGYPEEEIEKLRGLFKKE